MSENTGPAEVETVKKKHPGIENLRPWKPGQSGNPKGRPKSPSFKALIQEAAEMDKKEVVERLFTIAKKGRPSDAIRAADLLARHSADPSNVSVTTEDFTITIAPSTEMMTEEEEDDS